MLIGISLGPGDPEMLTFKAAKALRTCYKVFVPGEMAAELSRPYCSPELLVFPMIDDNHELERIWIENADIVANFASRRQVGFAVIGDVNTFSTFSHLKKVMIERHPEIEIKTIPGVGVIPALASKFGMALDKSYEVSDGSEVEAKIRMKATHPRRLAEDLQKQGFDEFILGCRLYSPQEKIVRGNSYDMPERSDYFSVLYARRKT
ncbi:MAG: cobalt-factor II C(20)-methyltransferase [Methanotrichaceae archaeon]|nr:cobalt-factor II C(20)-methyltransferase [Methanotrichaceae archaeon]